MRWTIILALALASVSIAAVAQKREKSNARPSYKDEKETKGAARPVRPPSTHNTSAKELHRLEQSSARKSTSRKVSGKKAAHTGAVVKAEKQERTPPIQFSSAGGGGGTKGKSKASSSYKGRLRHKGSRH